MHRWQEKIFLVVPCYNEETRIELEKFAQHSFQFVFVDDGSKDGTYPLLEKNKKTNWTVLKLPQNMGKAMAVREGFLHALRELNPTEDSWIGFWDADLATPLEEVEHLVQYQTHFYPQTQAIWGSRVQMLGSNIQRSLKRHVLGRFFATVVGVLFNMKVYDTQCGAKLFRPSLAQKVFKDPFISRWLFDIELLLRAQGAMIVECPLTHWAEIPGSKMKIARESMRVLSDLLKIRAWHRRQNPKP